MRTHHILIALAAASLIAGGAYLWLSVSDSPEEVKPSTAAKPTKSDSPVMTKRRPTAPGEIVLPNEGALSPDSPHYNGKEFVRRSTSPDLLPDGSKRPEPFQARSKPAKNHALFVGVHTEEMARTVDNVNTAYLAGRYDEVLDTAPDLIAQIPENQQLKRLLIRAACLAKEPDVARQWLDTVSESDQAYMKSHCFTYGSPLE